MVNIKDIAKKAKVSVGTVSRVINNNKTVKPRNKKLVLDVIKEYGYRPNKLAASLSKGKTKNIGIIIPDIRSPYFTEVIKGITDFFDRQNYYAFVSSSDENPKKEEIFINDYNSMWIDGVILIPSQTEKRNTEIFNSINFPMVLLDREIEGLNKDLIIINNHEGSYKATSFLIKNGHKKIPVICGQKFTKTAINRYLGWEKAMKENGFFDKNLVYWGEFSVESGSKIMKKILNDLGKVDAVFAQNDIIAIGAIQTMNSKNIKIPEDISIIGFDDVYFSKFLNPPLTTIKQPSYIIGEIAAETLHRRIMKKGIPIEPQRYVINGELIERKSVKQR
jgi:LacI family transcriptional regulator